MTKEQLQSELISGRISMKERDRLITEIVANKNLLEVVLQQVFYGEYRGVFNGSWVLPYVIEKDMHTLLPQLDFFTSELANTTSETAIRNLAKVCQLFTIALYKKNDDYLKKHTSTDHLEKIATACFDWLIGDYKVATKVFSMTSLLHLGKQFDWIHPELELILEQNYATGTSGYQNRARKTLDALKKLKKSSA